MSGPDHIGGPAWTWPKRGKLIMAGMREYKGNTHFDIREWVDGSDGQIATGRGVSIPLAAVEECGQAMIDFARNASLGEP